MKKMKSGLIRCFVGIALFSVIISLLGIWGLKTLNRSMQDIDSTSHNRYDASMLGTILYQQERNYLLLMLGEPLPESVFYQLDEDFLSIIDSLQTSLDAPEALTYVNDIRTLYTNKSTPVCHALADAIETGNEQEAMEQMLLLNEYAAALTAHAEGLVQLLDSEIDNTVRTGVVLSRAAATILIIFSLLALSGALLIASRQSKALSEPIEKLTSAAQSLAEGDIQVDVSVSSRNELGVLSAAFQKMIDGIQEQSAVLEQLAGGDYSVSVPTRSPRDIMNRSINHLIYSAGTALGEMRLTSRQVSSATEQIAQGAQSLASGSMQQSASVQQLSGMLVTMERKTNSNAANAQSADSVNRDTYNMLLACQEIMNQLLEAMGSIDDSAHSITKINENIEDIAFQTNLLALNASVEAARAGAHGKGFAVVADEVRNLAAKSTQAAQESARLIENTTGKVQDGNRLVRQTNEQLGMVAKAGSQLTALVKQVMEDSRQQAGELTDITKRLEDISGVIQGNTATAQQSAAATEELFAQSQIMDGIVGRFALPSRPHQASLAVPSEEKHSGILYEVDDYKVSLT